VVLRQSQAEAALLYAALHTGRLKHQPWAETALESRAETALESRAETALESRAETALPYAALHTGQQARQPWAETALGRGSEQGGSLFPPFLSAMTQE